MNKRRIKVTLTITDSKTVLIPMGMTFGKIDFIKRKPKKTPRHNVIWELIL